MNFFFDADVKLLIGIALRNTNFFQSRTSVSSSKNFCLMLFIGQKNCLAIFRKYFLQIIIKLAYDD